MGNTQSSDNILPALTSTSLAFNHRYQQPVANDGARQFNGDVHGTYNAGDVHNHASSPSPLDQLPTSDQAAFDASARQDDPPCLDGTRTEVQKAIRVWAYSNDSSCIFWLNGWAGTGKSTIARTIARKFHLDNCLGASFFFSRGGGDASNAKLFYTTIAEQLAIAQPRTLKPIICDAILKQPKIATKSRQDQWNTLVFGPLSQLQPECTQPLLAIVVDALDECEDDNDIKGLLRLFSTVHQLQTVKVRVIVTSRPDLPVRLGFENISRGIYQDLILQQQPEDVVNTDICLFYYDQLEAIKKKHSWLSQQWPSIDEMNQLVQGAAGLFIYAATVCRFVDNDYESPSELLQLFLPSDTPTLSTSQMDQGCPEEQPTHALDVMYIQILHHTILKVTNQKKKLHQAEKYREILGAIVVLAEPLSVSALANLTGLPEDTVYLHLNHLHSILNVPDPLTKPLSLVRLFHPSFRDFLLDSQRCTDPHFLVNGEQAHFRLLCRCLKVMAATLKEDMCGFRNPGVFAKDLEHGKLDKCIPVHVQYACSYWVVHLQRSNQLNQYSMEILEFLRKHLLPWLEALSWIGRITNSIQLVTDLHILVSGKNADLEALCFDAKRFILQNRAIIETSPLQVYNSALVFSPKNSLVRKNNSGSIRGWILQFPKVHDEWSQCVQTLEGHSDLVAAVVFSPDGKLVASASHDNTIKLWNIFDQTMLETIDVGASVEHLSFSSEGSSLHSNLGHHQLSASHLMLESTATGTHSLLSISNNWVAWDGHHVLWLPPEYRPRSSALYNNTLVIGSPSGLVTFMSFDSRKLAALFL